MKIIKTQIKKVKNNKIIPLFKHLDNLGYVKYLPSFTKEWKNIIYSYNKNTLRNIPVNYYNVNKIISNYFNSLFNNWQFIKDKHNIFKKKKMNYLSRVYVSNADINYTNNKAIITLYIINGEKNRVYNKYKYLNKTVKKIFINHFIKIYKNLPKKLYNIINNNIDKKYTFIKSLINKKTLIKYKFSYLNNLTKLNYYYIKKIWVILEKKYLNKRKYYVRQNINQIYNINNLQTHKKKIKLTKKSLQWYLLLLRRYQLIYTLNQFKFSTSKFLPILSNYLQKSIGKRVEYNFIKLKSITNNTDIMTKFLSLKVAKQKNSLFFSSLSSALNSPIIPEETNKVLARTPIFKYENIDPFFQKFKDSKLISNINIDNTTKSNKNNTLDNLLTEAYYSNDILYNNIYNSIKYKNIGGIKIELGGRLSKRNRADRAKHYSRERGGLRNNASSYRQWSNILVRGNTIANQSYSLTTSKRRVGSFAVKGWIVGK